MPSKIWKTRRMVSRPRHPVDPFGHRQGLEVVGAVHRAISHKARGTPGLLMSAWLLKLVQVSCDLSYGSGEGVKFQSYCVEPELSTKIMLPFSMPPASTGVSPSGMKNSPG